MMSEVGVNITESIDGKEILETTVDNRNKCFPFLIDNHLGLFILYIGGVFFTLDSAKQIANIHKIIAENFRFNQ